MLLLVCNAGSTSLRFKLYAMPEEQTLVEASIERVGSANAVFHYRNCVTQRQLVLEDLPILDYSTGILLFLEHLSGADAVVENLEEIERVGFKTVIASGYCGTHIVDEAVMQCMREMMVIAPSHNGPYIEVIDLFRRLLPSAILVGAFETEFHRTIPLERRLYGVPYEWYKSYGLQRMGYHGASHRYIAEQMAKTWPACKNIISCHLGGSASICAIQDGKSVDNSFGFSLQTGLIHAKRAGDTDPFIFPYLMAKGLTEEQVINGIHQAGGLLGISGVSSDLRDIFAQSGNNARAKLAIDVFCNGIIKYIGAYFAELGSVDALVFTGGIGENSTAIRSHVCDAIRHFGVVLDAQKNKLVRGDGVISEAMSPVKIVVLKTNEELVVARKTFYIDPKH